MIEMVYIHAAMVLVSTGCCEVVSRPGYSLPEGQDLFVIIVTTSSLVNLLLCTLL